MADGSILIDTVIDNTQAQKQLDTLKKSMTKLQKDLGKKTTEQSSIAKQMDDASAAADETRQKIKSLEAELKSLKGLDLGKVSSAETLNAKTRIPQIEAELKTSNATLQQQTKEADKLAAKYQKVSGEVNQITSELEVAKIAAGELIQKITIADYQKAADEVANMSKELERAVQQQTELVQVTERQAALQNEIGASPGMTVIGNATAEASKRMEKFGRRIKELVKSALIFSVLTSALTSMRDWLGKVIKTNEEAVVALAKLKGAFATLAQPLLNVVIPAFVTFVNILTKIINALASVVSALFGTTFSASQKAAEGLNEEQKALEGVGGAASDAEKQLASFDEINKLSEPSGGGGGGGGEISASFDSNDELDRKTKDILATVGAIGAGLLAWNIASGFTTSLSTIAGVAMAVAGAVLLVYNYISAWNDGIDWGNLLGMIGGLALVVGGLALAFGSMAAGIAAIVGGIALIALGFRDMFENGMNLQNTLAVIGGLLAGGLGIALLTGSWIPLLIAGIASVILAFVNWSGKGAELISGLKTIFRGFMNFFSGIFSGDIEKTISGIQQIFYGLKQVLFSIVDSIKIMFNKFLDWIEEKTGIKLDAVREFFNTTFSAIKKIISGLITFLTGVFTGDLNKAMSGIEIIWDGLKTFIDGIIDGLRGLLNDFLTWLSDTTGIELGKVKEDFDIAFNAAKDIVNDVIEGVKGVLNGLVSFITDALTGNLETAMLGIEEAFDAAFTAAANIVVDIINGMIGVINNALTLTLPTWEVLDVIGLPDWKGKTISLGKLPTIPKLAEGKVIPPNREFMAVLGDQKSGTNIEAPLSTIEQAMRNVLGSGYGGKHTVIMEIDGREFGRVTYDAYNRESQRLGVSLGGV